MLRKFLVPAGPPPARVLAVGVLAVGVLLVGLSATPAFAHEQRTVGAYQLTVGWQHEPTYSGVENAVQLTVKDARGNPIDDLGDPPTLHVTVGTGNQTSDPLDLKPSFDPDTGFGTHGEFDAAVIPTRAGTYTFHFTGTINGQPVDEKFTSSDKTFDDVKEPSAVEFPAKDPTTGQLATNVNRLSPRVEAAASAAKSGKDRAGTAIILSIVALAAAVVIGGTGLVTGVAARRRTR
jgi:hypothetical protein